MMLVDKHSVKSVGCVAIELFLYVHLERVVDVCKD